MDIRVKIDLILRKNGMYGGIVESVTDKIMEVIELDN